MPTTTEAKINKKKKKISSQTEFTFIEKYMFQAT